ncbi:pilus assembly protein [Halopseudomonas phragmitis]|uniref:Pilus assembly protein n=2 Tax=Pseudomonadaceae TaxID=135621 RepID=A0A1V0B6E0_9GAMM|nr:MULTISPECIES: hypothetical protein [Pseudomonadaceae]AQZ95512.1 hypothetical protein BVH74_12455 [Halopseudomonas phragmitis]RHW22522.1 pilus assembly protein [Pseudomonas jilinensis]
MRSLTLEFNQTRKPGWQSWMTLGVGGLACLISLSFYTWRDEQPAMLPRAPSSTSTELVRSPAQMRLQAQMLNEMRRVSAQMNRPWERLFVTLETLPMEDIGLLGLATDARKGQLRIQAEARDLEAMLAFHRRLEEGEALSDVYLLNHEVLERNPGRPVRFSLLLTWRLDDDAVL